jgi:hypothetical protein
LSQSSLTLLCLDLPNSEALNTEHTEAISHSQTIRESHQVRTSLCATKGIPEHKLKKVISLSIAKINIDADLCLASTKTVREMLANSPKQFHTRKNTRFSQGGDDWAKSKVAVRELRESLTVRLKHCVATSTSDFLHEQSTRCCNQSCE